MDNVQRIYIAPNGEWIFASDPLVGMEDRLTGLFSLKTGEIHFLGKIVGFTPHKEGVGKAEGEE